MNADERRFWFSSQLATLTPSRALKPAQRSTAVEASKKSDPNTGIEINFTRAGTIIGASSAATIYAATYPVTFIDGPLPIIDVAWAIGLAKATSFGAARGKRIGMALDLIIN